jgi:hypothetical protein
VKYFRELLSGNDEIAEGIRLLRASAATQSSDCRTRSLRW